jgi:hypothetical protein
MSLMHSRKMLSRLALFHARSTYTPRYELCRGHDPWDGNLQAPGPEPLSAREVLSILSVDELYSVV